MKYERKPLDAAQINERLKERFGEAILALAGAGENKYMGDPFIEVAADRIQEIALFLRDADDLWFDSLMNLSSVDDSGLKTYQKAGEEAAARRFSIVYSLHSMLHFHKINIKCFLPEDNPTLPTVSNIWPGANWHEREAFDLMGVVFEEHPDPRRILCPDDWVGFPLRKDYVTPEFYNGMPARGEPVPPPDAIEKQRLKDEEEQRKLQEEGTA